MAQDWRCIMAAITVRGLDDQVVKRLKDRAKLNGRSMEAEVRRILSTAVQEPQEPERIDFWEHAAELRRMTPPRRQTPSEVLIREDRDGGHRF